MARKFLPVVIAGVLLLALVPVVSAYEAHIINVTARVEQREFDIDKTMRPATEGEIASANASGIIFPTFPNIPDNSGVYQENGVWHVVQNTCVVWLVTFTIYNPYDYCSTNVTVKDHFGAELTGIDNYGKGIYWLDGVKYDVQYNVGSGPVYFYYSQAQQMPQFRIFWYATYQSGNVYSPPNPYNPHNPPDPNVDNSELLCTGNSTTLKLLVWTRINPGGHQEYTSTGTKEFNSGATMKWLDPEGHRHSNVAPSLEVVVD